ncbi:hypothetical protein PVAND_011443 [Polypedilum vanderplanki]|uniref:Ig-like domain-containing protein n=1 Tax=Polypedilum vanderplanki TaxID=319348 RepID=A0A9J6CIL3_POLVA|nr:hypothetical protein PVAND_011443 [Polypedilum vanderplanki]
MKSIVLHIIVLLTLYLARECQAVKINKISVPSYFDLHSENKNQPLILECDYDTDDDDTGVVLKWLLNSVSIYQWIPLNTVNPTGLKSFKNRIDLEYNKDLPEKQRYSTLVIKNPTIADTGNYSCDVQTFKSHDRKTAPITIVYVDDSIKLNYFIDEIENQVNFECSINQIYPLPEVTFLIGNEARNFSSPLETHVFTNIYHNISVSAQINKEEIEDDEEVTCLVRIPTIDYEKKASVHYDENYGHMIRANLLLSIIMYLILLMIKSMAF